ncbi:hypothetical protein [Cystobacter fuscus]|uniref:hypothetical protein n=1 Tax=Cystobacter fuscus TaxID=43 RepID=UPI0012DFE152|nr:hypothetical protein [Cystobacter fuscus]
MKSLSVLLWGMAVVTLAGCSTETLPPESAAGETPSTGVSESELSGLLAPEPGAAAAAYEARTARYRLFGVQLNPVRTESFATLADTSTWETRNLHVGELLGRNLRVTAITSAGLQLTGPKGSQLLPVGREVSLRVIRHLFDTAAVHEGRLHWKVKGSVVSQLRGQYGLGAQAETVTVFPRPALRLTHVQENGVFARLGLHEGDLLLRMNGEPLSPDQLGALADRLSTPGGTVNLQMYREASFQTLTFTVDRP